MVHSKILPFHLFWIFWCQYFHRKKPSQPYPEKQPRNTRNRNLQICWLHLPSDQLLHRFLLFPTKESAHRYYMTAPDLMKLGLNLSIIRKLSINQVVEFKIPKLLMIYFHCRWFLLKRTSNRLCVYSSYLFSTLSSLP